MFHPIEADSFDAGYQAGKKDAMRWIPVGERLPENFQRVLVCDEQGDITIALLDHYLDVFVDLCGSSTVQPKWWMRLPEPPKGEQDVEKN